MSKYYGRIEHRQAAINCRWWTVSQIDFPSKKWAKHAYWCITVTRFICPNHATGIGGNGVRWRQWRWWLRWWSVAFQSRLVAWWGCHFVLNGLLIKRGTLADLKNTNRQADKQTTVVLMCVYACAHKWHVMWMHTKREKVQKFIYGTR